MSDVDWSAGELIVICQAHRRRCYLQPAGADGGIGARVRHRGGGSSDGDLCMARRFWVRREIILTDNVLLGAVLEEEMGVHGCS